MIMPSLGQSFIPESIRRPWIVPEQKIALAVLGERKKGFLLELYDHYEMRVTHVLYLKPNPWIKLYLIAGFRKKTKQNLCKSLFSHPKNI